MESTIISHGVPYPQNVETALRVERIICENDAVPATIAVTGGRLRADLSKEEIDYLGKKGLNITKANRRDLPVLAARGEDGTATATATMVVTVLVGISVFATDSIGGVRRGVETTVGISADPGEPAVTPMTAVCTGAKSILGPGLTMECPETKGVPVLGYQMEELPVFYVHRDGFKVDYHIDTPAELTNILQAKEGLNLRGDLFVTSPIPEELIMDHGYTAESIDGAYEETHRLGIEGKDTTPYPLDKIQKITGSKSLDVNTHLVYSSATLDAKATCELCKPK